ncbi:hypothetical protein HDU76_005787 [Blyttiomyces sp. JEL0837]|nr:hypothetical protein HDU76_005787 [Blyttiomyces sp. JEL0837]
MSEEGTSIKVARVVSRVKRLSTIARPIIAAIALVSIGISLGLLTSSISNSKSTCSLANGLNGTLNVNVKLLDPKILDLLKMRERETQPQGTHSFLDATTRDEVVIAAANQTTTTTTTITATTTTTSTTTVTVIGNTPKPQIVTIEKIITVETPKPEPTDILRINAGKDTKNLTIIERTAYNPYSKKHNRYPNCDNDQPKPTEDNDPKWKDERAQKKLWKEFLGKMSKEYDPKAYGVVPGSRGIVFSTHRMGIPILLRTVLILRDLGCELPIELAYIKDDVGDEELKMLEYAGITPLNITDRLNNITFDGDKTHYGAVKPFAVLYSSFEQALFLDYENIPVRDPTELFDSEEFKTYGSLFWGDFSIRKKDSPLWWLMELCHENQPEFESGQILVDKRVAWKGLEFAKHMAFESNYYFEKMLGDKETFYYGYAVTKTPFALSPYYITPLGHIVSNEHRKGGTELTKENKIPENAVFCAQTMLQYDFKGRPIFAHGNGVKYSFFAGTSPFSVAMEYVFREGKLASDYPEINYQWIGDHFDQERCIELPDRFGLERRWWNWTSEHLLFNAKFNYAHEKSLVIADLFKN